MNIAGRIQDLRKQKGYSQEQLAEKVGFGITLIIQVVSGMHSNK